MKKRVWIEFGFRLIPRWKNECEVRLILYPVLIDLLLNPAHTVCFFTQGSDYTSE